MSSPLILCISSICEAALSHFKMLVSVVKVIFVDINNLITVSYCSGYNVASTVSVVFLTLLFFVLGIF